MTRKRNVLFVIIDQLRADCLFGALADHVDLPNLRALSENAVTFRRHYSVANPCGPSRASILTGQYATNHRSVRNGTPLRHDTPNLASELRKLGYVPYLFGYTDTSQDPRIHAADDPALRSYEQPMKGFHEVIEMQQEASFPWRAHLISKGYTFDNYMDIYHPVAPDTKPVRPNDPAMYRAEDSDTAFLTDGCLSFLAARTKGESWFAHLTYIRPHPPLVAPEPYNRMYDPALLPMPKRLTSKADECAVHPFFAPAHKKVPVASTVKGFADLQATDDVTQILRSLYLGLASEVDHHIGRIVRFLKETGQYDDTLLVVTSDHGEMLGERHSWGKQTVYDAAYHIPLIIRDPNNINIHGQSFDIMTESVDVTPTILDWFDLPVPSSMDGHSLMPFVRGDTPERWRQFSYSELDFGNPALPTIWQTDLGLQTSDANLSILRGSRHTLVHFNGGLPPLLFDHEGDGEFCNLANDPVHTSVVLQMTQRMLDHRMSNADHTLSTTMITSKGPVVAARR